ncbi:NAD(P)H-dependent glycerol-3-phosphate dehydrogenase [Herbaspirillum sp. RTI4]|uniref:NAD(P)H-dependent glycerol-3-phosphate dehydrogenase n=1 Tax=Herbaspirillum sp. RTI4 TaxID=3048640 RepID=UPI002AB4FE64|nr:NAD(P)H-dependent glycerol-3-phosphate dehydrogenase [Herbaspirillum sp. RTI4]MDY7577369.1 NAD(P)H-dependent glycerol-3-phosphate dehydrogenase [Herbaspirillum sp. RTI4]MEA9982403.1 NAD(P)H-dependent glycerol-3-phosphate dehydrogenase [Herbaspirillum sp. RTI4]
MNITVFGAGAWGSALAIGLANHHDLVLWGRDADTVGQMALNRENTRYLPGHRLPDSLRVTSDFTAAVAHANPDGLLIAASPVAGLRELAQRLQLHAASHLIWLCKGLEYGTHLLPHQVIHQVMGEHFPAGALSGPSFAQEVAAGMPCALTLASTNAALRERAAEGLHGGNLRVYSSDDVIGVEVGGAVKNILAIATGVADGLQLGLNARAALITRGLAEITRFGMALGGRMETFMGLSGIGDLILTCTGDLSRNRRVGLSLARGTPLATIEQELGHVAEGVRCAQAVRALARQYAVDMPITEAVADALFDGLSVQQLVDRLLARDQREETR